MKLSMRVTRHQRWSLQGDTTVKGIEQKPNEDGTLNTLFFMRKGRNDPDKIQVITAITPQAKLGSYRIEKVNRALAQKVAAPPHQLSRKLLRLLDRLGCFSFLSALASIWRMRSRVTENFWPTSSSV
jgi:hypothetical protein